MSLLLINTASRKIMLFSFSKRIIICVIDIEEEIYMLNFSKVQYLLNYGINIFKAKKLLGKGDI